MYESPFWVGWSAGSWGTSWGYDSTGKPIEVFELHQGGPDGKGRSVRSRYADDVFTVDREGGRYAVRPANWRAPWQQEDPVSPTPVEAPPTPLKPIAQAMAPAARRVPVSQADLNAARVAVDKVVASARQAIKEAEQARLEEALALATTLLLLMDDEDY
jgi:hypothetical protein